MTTRNSLSNQKTLVHHLSSRQQQRHATKNFPAAIFQNFFFFCETAHLSKLFYAWYLWGPATGLATCLHQKRQT